MAQIAVTVLQLRNMAESSSPATIMIALGAAGAYPLIQGGLALRELSRCGCDCAGLFAALRYRKEPPHWCYKVD